MLEPGPNNERGDHHKIQHHAQPVRLLQIQSRQTANQSHRGRFLELGHFIFHFPGSFIALVRQLSAWAVGLRRRLMASWLLLLGRCGFLLLGMRRLFLGPERHQAGTSHHHECQKTGADDARGSDLWGSHQRPAPAGCSTRRTISCASASTSADKPFSAPARSFSISRFAACTWACVLLRASCSALARACSTISRRASWAWKIAARAARSLCSYSAVRASAAAMSARDFSTAPSVLLRRSASTRCNGFCTLQGY